MKHHNLFHLYSFSSLLFIIPFLFSGCSGTVKEPVVFIPEDAQIAIHIDLKSMSDKAENWQRLFSPDNLSKWDVPIESQETMSKVIQEGLDTQSPVLVFGKTKDDKYSVLAFRAKDRSVFQDIIESDGGKFKSIEGFGGYYVVLKEGRSYAFAENDGILLINKEGETDDIIDFYKTLKQVTKENSLSIKNEVYKNLIGQDHEIAFWLDAPILSNDNFSALQSLGLPSPSGSGEENRQATGLVVFENGKAFLEFDMSLDEKLKNQLGKILDSQSAEAVKKNIPISEPSALAAFSLNMDGLYEQMKADGQTRSMTEGSEFLGLSEQEMMNIFKGSAALNLGKLSLLSLGEGKIKADAVLSIPLNNTEAVQKILEEAVKEEALEKVSGSEDFYFTQQEVYDLYLVDIFMFVKDKTFYMTITEEMRDKILKGTHSLNSDFTTMLKDKGIFIYFDIPKVYDEIGLLGANVFEEVDVKAIAEAVTSAHLGIPAIKDGKLRIRLDINTSDKNKNALEVLVELLENNSGKNPA